ncbi:MAG: hypothetical protein GXY86_12910 [Firmicutes bacterium]|nr:hypothetical protein [Bacillota bacterium]
MFYAYKDVALTAKNVKGIGAVITYTNLSIVHIDMRAREVSKSPVSTTLTK